LISSEIQEQLFEQKHFWLRVRIIKMQKNLILNENEVMDYLKEINYENGVLEVSMKNNQTFGKLKKKLCKRFCLEVDTVLINEEKR
jgi:hypothetical protein